MILENRLSISIIFIIILVPLILMLNAILDDSLPLYFVFSPFVIVFLLIYLNNSEKIIGLLFIFLFFRSSSILENVSIVKILSIPLFFLLLFNLRKENHQISNFFGSYVKNSIIFLCLLGITVITSKNIDTSFKYFTHFIGPFISGLFGYALTRYTLNNKLCLAGKIITLIIAIFILQYIFVEDISTIRLSIGSANANWIATPLILSSILFMYEYYYGNRAYLKWILITFLLVVITGSRSAIAVMLIGNLYFITMAKGRKQFFKFASFFSILYMVYYIAMNQLTEYQSSVGYQHILLTNVDERIYLIKDAFAGIKNMPFWGYGLGTRYYNSLHIGSRSHVMFLEILVQAGWLAGLWFVYFCIYPLLKLWFNKIKYKIVKDDSWQLYFILWFVLLLHANLHGTYYVNHYTWFVLAMSYGYIDKNISTDS